MTLEERIKQLFLSLEEGNIIFGAKLLSSVESVHQQIQIFRNCCNTDIERGNSLQEHAMVSSRVYPKVGASYPHSNIWVRVTADNWELFFVPGSRIYMVKRDFDSSITADKIIIL
jgi:hypothetical protein